MRYLTPFLQKDLSRKLVLLSGPRQVGKSTLARSLLDEKGVYLNWDIRGDKRAIRDIAWRKDASLVVLDELHKLPKWKNFLKGVIDQFGNRPPILVTGSARLDLFRRSGDALTGRTFHHRLHPIDLEEAGAFLPGLSGAERLSRLLQTGGFPEAFLDPPGAERLRNDRFDVVVREDLRDLSRTSAVQALGLLIELLRDSSSSGSTSFSWSSPTPGAWPAASAKSPRFTSTTAPPLRRKADRAWKTWWPAPFSSTATSSMTPPDAV